MDEVEQDVSGFLPLYGFAQVTGLLAVVLMAVWMGHYRGGFAWQSDPDHQFNWHPLLMSISLIYLYGNGILLYRVLRTERKKKLKLLHAGVMVTSFFLACIALKAVFDSHNLNKAGPIPNLYSLHSWVGIITVILFLLQWFGGLLTFLFPGLASHLRAAYLPVHVFFGLLIFVLACVTACLGILEKLLFSIKATYGKGDPEGVLANWIGLLIIAFAVTIVYIAANPRYKRLNRPEDEMLLSDTTRE